MVLMEYVSPTGLSLWTLTCVVCCLLTCVKPGQSVKCNGALCGYGTEQSCRIQRWCSCQSQFSGVSQHIINNQTVQFCLEICDDKTCPLNYQCVGNKHNPYKRCLCDYGYKRSANGECVVSVTPPTTRTRTRTRTRRKSMPRELVRSRPCSLQESCTGLNCELLGRRCLERPDGDVCGSTCATGFKSSSNGGCIDVNECFNGSRCANNAHSKCFNTHGSFRCDCVKGYGKSSNSNVCEDIDECSIKTTCDDKQNTLCVNSPAGSFQCDCLDGYNRSDNKECKDIDECLHEGICDKNNNTGCVNTLGSFNCECLPGYTSDNKTSCHVKITVAGLTSTNDESSVGLYVGVTIGVLVLLGMVVAAIIVRRRRNSKKSHEGIAEFSSREPEHNENPTNVYDNVSLDNEHVDLPTETRTNKTVSVEYSNGKIPLNKLARNSSSISVEYSNNKILASTKRNGTQRPEIGTDGSGEERIYIEEDIPPLKNRPDKMTTSPNPIKAVNLNDSGVYNTLDVFSLNTTNEPKRRQQITSESESHVYGTPYEEHVLPNSINKENMATFPNLVAGDTFDDPEAHNTLEAFNLNTHSKLKTETRIEKDHDPYNMIL